MASEELKDELIAAIMELTKEEASELLRWCKEMRAHG